MLIAGNMPPKLGGQPHDDRGDYFEPKSPLESIKSGDPQGLECYQQAMRKSAEADFAACAMEKIKMELDTGLWQALVVLQRALLNEHHDFSLPHERDSYSPALRRLSRKYLWPVMAKKARRGLATTLRLISYINQHHYKRLSGYSSASKRYYVKGSVDGLPIEAFPDSGAEKCFISPEMASNLGLSPMTNTQRATRLANKKQVQSPGMVQVPWIFAGEDEQHLLKCWILPGCIHDLVLGHDFIKMTQTFTKFKQRVKNKLSSLRAPFLRLLGSGRQRVVGFLNGEMTFAMPDTGSDLMLVSGPHARRNGLLVDNGSEHRLEVGLADGSTCLTTGVVRDVSWAVGDKTVRCEFHVLEDLCVDVVLSKDYLFDLEIFSTYPEWFIDIDSEENVFHFFNIRLLGRYGSELNALEEQYLVDLFGESWRGEI
ncbi:Putative aspartic peptidase domain superfamily [Colletotrichum destructivum]|uniref:Aspartic peptidase domain superfamily n=1 Tax=Colletotrichum destructivum TaxID=34406 RepID=A0AAX4IB35_9PEZI|nr:Putative aspartic peptidase domain superfamily [Colletotrichum destructivum]